MILIGETIGHIDHAPPRGITQTFKLENTGYTLLSTVYAPTNLRVHVLDDAQRAFDEGDFNLALAYYARAANDDLSTVYSYNFQPDIASEYDFPDDYQRSFALFRLAIIQLVLGNRNDAELTLAELMARYPENNKGHEFVVLTEIFFDAFNDGKNIEESCNNVTKFIAENYVPKDNSLENPNLTSHFYWGSNIAAYYKPESFCPIFTTSIEQQTIKICVNPCPIQRRNSCKRAPSEKPTCKSAASASVCQKSGMA